MHITNIIRTKESKKMGNGGKIYSYIILKKITKIGLCNNLSNTINL